MATESCQQHEQIIPGVGQWYGKCKSCGQLIGAINPDNCHKPRIFHNVIEKLKRIQNGKYDIKDFDPLVKYVQNRAQHNNVDEIELMFDKPNHCPYSKYWKSCTLNGYQINNDKRYNKAKQEYNRAIKHKKIKKILDKLYNFPFVFFNGPKLYIASAIIVYQEFEYGNNDEERSHFDDPRLGHSLVMNIPLKNPSSYQVTLTNGFKNKQRINGGSLYFDTTDYFWKKPHNFYQNKQPRLKILYGLWTDRLMQRFQNNLNKSPIIYHFNEETQEFEWKDQPDKKEWNKSQRRRSMMKTNQNKRKRLFSDNKAYNKKKRQKIK